MPDPVPSSSPVSTTVTVHTIPSTPDPELLALVAMLIRYLLVGASVVGIYHGATSGAPLETAIETGAGAAVMVGMVLWALWERIEAAWKAHQNAVASAAKGVPVEVVSATPAAPLPAPVAPPLPPIPPIEHPPAPIPPSPAPEPAAAAQAAPPPVAPVA